MGMPCALRGGLRASERPLMKGYFVRISLPSDVTRSR